MNSSLKHQDSSDNIGLHSPNYLFVADRKKQQILYCSSLSPSPLLQQDNHEPDLYQAYVASSSAPILKFRNIKEDLMDIVSRAEESHQGHLFRFKDDNGYWRIAFLETTTLFGGVDQKKELCCGILSLLNNPTSLNNMEDRILSRLVWGMDTDQRLTYVNHDCRTLGYDVESLLSSGQPAFLGEETHTFIESVCQSSHVDVETYTRVFKHTLRTVDGSSVSATIQLTLMFDDDGKKVGSIGIAEFFPSRELLESERQLFSAMFESISEGIFITDRSGFILRANPAFYQVTGYHSNQILGLHCSQLWQGAHGPQFFRKIRHGLLRNDHWRDECVYRRCDGENRPALLSFSKTHNSKNEVQYYVGMLMDIAEKKQSEMRIHRLAYYDALTNVPNRRLFNEKLNEAVAQAQDNGTVLAVLFLDLDRFKPVNDSLGHSAGDQLLKGVARRLMYCLREIDTVARMGGDEFAIVLPALDEDLAEQTAIKMASRVLAQFFAPFLIDGREVYTSTSIGIALYPHHGYSAEILLRGADTAMYAAKRAGKNNYQFYDDRMNKKAMDRLIMENALRKALVNEEFELYFQPQYSVVNGTMTGVEVLLRWSHELFGNVKPLEFIDLAEQTDLIIPLGEWVFQQTCEKIAQWQTKGVTFGRVGVNVSANQFKRSDFADWVLFQIQRYGINPYQLEIELTESTLMEDVEHSLELLQKLQQANIRIAIDDFGTGYSSLSYLKKFPISTLKIDRVFIEDIVENTETRELAQTVIAIAKSLKLGVIAEGVETWEQYRLLSEQGCDEVQGYYLSRALSESALLELVVCESD